MIHRTTLRDLKLVRLDDKTAVPRRFGATATLESGHGLELEVAVDDAGAPSCVSLTVHGDKPVTTEVVRQLRVDELVRVAVAEAARPYEQAGASIRMPIFPAPDERAELYERFAKGGRRPRRGSPVSEETLHRVAALYRAALKNGDPPTSTIAEALRVTRSTASRWVAKAREAGLLGPAIRGRAGEAN